MASTLDLFWLAPPILLILCKSVLDTHVQMVRITYVLVPIPHDIVGMGVSLWLCDSLCVDA